MALPECNPGETIEVSELLEYIEVNAVEGPPGPKGEEGPPGEDGSPGTTDHEELSNIGTNTHDQIDTHIADVTNPHDVTYDNIQGEQPAPIVHTHTEDDITDLVHYDDDDADLRIQDAIQDDTVSTVTLYSSNKVESLIEGALTYQGQWDASTNTPTLVDGVGTAGDFYKVSVAGTQDLGSGSIDFIVGDRATYNSSGTWERIPEATTANWGQIYGTLSDQVDLQDALDAKVDDNSFNIHLADMDNPHTVTYDNIGGDQPDPLAHTHTEVEITNLDKYTQGQVDAAILVVQQDVDTHEALTDNPHAVTLAQIGGEPADADIQAHLIDTANPHNTTYANIGGIQPAPVAHTHVEANITDLDKYTQTEVDTAIGVVQTDVNDHEARVDNPHTVTQTQVGLGSVDDTADVDKPISTDTQAQLDLKVVWKGEWVGATYYLNDMVRDGVYTSIALVTTTDRPAPQNIGYSGHLYNGVLTPYQQDAKQVIFGTRYVAASAIKLTGYRVDVVTGNEYHMYAVSDPMGDPVITHLNSFVADTTGWVNIPGAEIIIGNGLTFDIICEVNEPAGTPTVTAFNYDYDTPNNAGTPGAGQIEHSNADTSNLLVRKTDDDGNNNSTFLEGLTAGDIIELDTIRWTIQSVDIGALMVTYQISPAVQYGNDGVASFNFETVTATPITVGYELNANLATTASGLYIIDGRYIDIIPDDNQYGVDIEVQEISISPDWEIVATSASAGGGSEGGTTVEIIDNLVTQDSSKALSANMGYVLNQNELSHTSDTDNPHSVTYEQLGGTQPDPLTHSHTESDITDLTHYTDGEADARVQAAIQDTVISQTTLYSSTKIEDMIEGSLTYEGTWNASTNVPVLIDGTGTVGQFYKVDTAGTQDLGSGSTDFVIGDRITYSALGVWERSPESITATWGQVHGTLSDQTDLQDELNTKIENVIEDITPELGGDLDCLNKKIDNANVVKFNGLVDNGTKSSGWILDANAGQYQKVTVDGDCTVSFTNFDKPVTIYLHVHQGATGGVLTLPAGTWIDKTPVPFTIGALAQDILMIHYYGAYTYAIMLNIG